MGSQKPYDAVVVGAGLAGLYMLHRLRELGLRARVLEAGDGVGGTWYWNRYPGARCDVESVYYQYGFSEEIQRDWTWTERYPAQPEILGYINYVAKRLDLIKDISFSTRVTSAHYRDAERLWSIATDCTEVLTAKYCIMATGCLSASRIPRFEGIGEFQGEWFHTGAWPKTEVEFRDKRVAVIGTGSSGVQIIPVIAAQAERVYVFQRTPNFSIPAFNRPLEPAEVEREKINFVSNRKLLLQTALGTAPGVASDRGTFEVTPEQREQEYRRRIAAGGYNFLFSFTDILINKASNDLAADFLRNRISQIVKDPETAAGLSPTNHPVGTKRPCIDTDYYETYNKPNVTLVDIRKAPIARITRRGILAGEEEYSVDTIVFATGYDAMTGALLRIDIRGKGGLPLGEKWASGPKTYLGLMVAGFPNFFTITGPGSPSVLANMVLAIEQHVEFVARCIGFLQSNAYHSMEPHVDAEDGWVAHVNEVANSTLYPLADSWYLGANVPGKPRVFMPYAGGLKNYRDRCDEVVRDGFSGFEFSRMDSVPVHPELASYSQ